MKERPVIISEGDLYAKAVEFTLRHTTMGTAKIQRHLKCSYWMASAIVQRMENEGMITAPHWNGVRTVIHVGSDASK